MTTSPAALSDSDVFRAVPLLLSLYGSAAPVDALVATSPLAADLVDRGWLSLSCSPGGFWSARLTAAGLEARSAALVAAATALGEWSARVPLR